MQLWTSVVLFVPWFAPLGVGAENAHQIDSVSDLSSVQKAYIDPKTHEVFVENEARDVAALEERSYQTGNPRDTVVKLLKKHNGYGFCKAFCPGYSPKPVTKTNIKTSVKTIYKTSTRTPVPVTVTLTTTGNAPPAVAVTETTTQSTTVDVALTAEPSTITSTSAVFTTKTETITTTITSTISIPTETVVRRHAPSPPSWLRGYASHLFCPACNQAWPKPKPKTVTACKTTTRYSTVTRTTSIPAPTRTATATVTPVANTFTTTEIATFILTNTETTTPLQTVTEETTSTTTVTQTATSTVTLCAQQTNGVAGISAASNGMLMPNPARTIGECCLACFNEPRGCQGWTFLGPNFCFYGVSANTATGGLCPNGKGHPSFFTDGPSNLAGGPGPCYS